MAVAEIPTKMGPDFLIKTMVPGLLVFFVFSKLIFYPLTDEFWVDLSFGDMLLMYILMGFLVGLFFMLCDLYIYQILEGIRFWPRPLWRWKYNRQQKRFQALDEELEDLIMREEESAKLSTTELQELSLKISKLSDRAREYPSDYDKKNFTRRYPEYPTRFGNVLCEYEDYSLNRYGIHMMVFWNHLSQLLPKETKEELKLKGAIADLCVYLCFASLLYIIIGPVALLLQSESWVTIWGYLIPVKSLLHFFLSILIFRLFYELSITQHKDYGRFVKSIFDLYRGKLAGELGVEIKRTHFASKEELEEERALWRKYQNYYLDYRFIKKKT